MAAGGAAPQANNTAFAAWERWSASAAGTITLFAWAVAEATVWPILPDFLLVPMAIGNRRRYYVPLAVAFIGMAIGGSCLYLFAYWQPSGSLHLLHHLPTVHQSAIDRAHRYLADHGLLAFLFQPVSGVPFKVWAIVAGAEGRNPAVAIPLFILARGTRMAVLATLACILGRRFTGFIRRYFILLTLVYLALFVYIWLQLIH